jgi:hypothetical protein
MLRNLSIRDNPSNLDLSICRDMAVHCGLMVHLLKTSNSLQCLSLHLGDFDYVGVLNELSRHATVHTLSLSFGQGGKVHSTSLRLRQLLKGLTTLRHLNIEHVAFTGDTMEEMLQGLSSFGDSAIGLYLGSCSFDKSAMKKFAAFMHQVDEGQATKNPIRTLKLVDPTGVDDPLFSNAVAAICTGKSPLRDLTIRPGRHHAQMGGFLRYLIKNSPTQLQRLTLYGVLNEAEISLLSGFIQGEVHLKTLSICKTNEELQEKFAQSLRHNGSIWHARLHVCDIELSKLYGKRNNMIPALLGRETSRMAHMSLFPILLTVSKAAKSMAPNNMLTAMLTSCHSIGPSAETSN